MSKHRRGKHPATFTADEEVAAIAARWRELLRVGPVPPHLAASGYVPQGAEPVEENATRWLLKHELAQVREILANEFEDEAA